MGTQNDIYTLRIALAGCCYDARVNDVPIFRDTRNGFPMTTTMAVNEYLVAGHNTLSISLVPAPGADRLVEPGESFSISILGRRAGRPKTDDHPLIAIRLRPGAEPNRLVTMEGDGAGLLIPAGGPRVAGNGVERLDVSLDFSLVGPSFAWAWQNSAPIPDAPATRDSLRVLFADWATRLEKRDGAWLRPILTERNAELSRALFERPADVEAHGIFDALGDSTLSFYDPDLAHSKLLIFGGGRLARLLRWNDTPILVFLEPDRENARFFPMTFRKDSSGWIVCR